MSTPRDVDAAGAAKLLTAASAVTVLCHVQPDADALGSALALGAALRRAGTPVQVAFASPADVPESMGSLPGLDLRVPAGDVRREVDLLVTVDCGSAGRLGALADRLAGAGDVLVVDHHASNTRFGTHHLVDATAESTTVLVTDVLDAWGVDLDADLAHCLYAGLATDTGSFRFSGARGLELAARLVGLGVDPAAVTRPLLDTHPFGWLRMLSTVLGDAQLDRTAAGGRGLVWAVVPLAVSAGLRAEESESVVDLVRTTAEAEVAAVAKETAPGTWSVSLRAREADVGAVAGRLGGGGHRLAAGYTAAGTADEVVRALRDTVG